MKKYLLLLIAVLTISGSSFAQKTQSIQPNQIPAQASSFIKKYWLEANIFRANKTNQTYIVTLDNATTICFDRNGRWQRITAFDQIPTDMLPRAIVAYLAQFYPEAILLQADKLNNGYRIRLDNELILQFNTKGQFQKLI